MKASFGMQFQFDIFIGLEVGNDDLGLPSITKLWELPFNIPPIQLFDACFDAPLLSTIGEACCRTPSPTRAPQWITVKNEHIISKDNLGVIIEAFDTTYMPGLGPEPTDGMLKVMATITNAGCGGTQSHIFWTIDDSIDGDLFTKWSKIRYTMGFWGSSTCWSILGDTSYGNFANNYDFGLREFTVLGNNLAKWNGVRQVQCDSNADNFWKVEYGQIGELIENATASAPEFRVEQIRDINVNNAGMYVFKFYFYCYQRNFIIECLCRFWIRS